MSTISVNLSEGVVISVTGDTASEYAARVAQAFSGPLYGDTAAGLAATSDGDGFAVDNGDGTAGVFLNDGGTAVLIRTIIINPMNEGAAALLGRAGGGTIQSFIDSIPKPNAIVTRTGTTHTLKIAEENATLIMKNAGAITLTLPKNWPVNLAIGATFRIIQGDAGAVTFSPAAGVTVNTRTGLTTTGQWAVAYAQKIANNTFVVWGDVA